MPCAPAVNNFLRRGGYPSRLPLMFVKDVGSSDEIMAGDETILRELLHPLKADLKIHYSLAHATVKPGLSSLPHRLKTSEVYYILEGEGIMYVEEESADVRSGQVIYIPPNSTQYIKNTGNSGLKFLCIVDPAWRPEDEEVL
jgi:mannose-6-phosphate isomerase-like protein (cupin superfamily)